MHIVPTHLVDHASLVQHDIRFFSVERLRETLQAAEQALADASERNPLSNAAAYAAVTVQEIRIRIWELSNA